MMSREYSTLAKSASVPATLVELYRSNIARYDKSIICLHTYLVFSSQWASEWPCWRIHQVRHYSKRSPATS